MDKIDEANLLWQARCRGGSSVVGFTLVRFVLFKFQRFDVPETGLTINCVVSDQETKGGP